MVEIYADIMKVEHQLNTCNGLYEPVDTELHEPFALKEWLSKETFLTIVEQSEMSKPEASDTPQQIDQFCDYFSLKCDSSENLLEDDPLYTISSSMAPSSAHTSSSLAPSSAYTSYSLAPSSASSSSASSSSSLSSWSPSHAVLPCFAELPPSLTQDIQFANASQPQNNVIDIDWFKSKKHSFTTFKHALMEGCDATKKKTSDSRLSLAQLSIILGLGDNIIEAGRREKMILNVFKHDLKFPLGERTWIRDTPPEEREALITNLHGKVEAKYHFGYPKSVYTKIIRRASYSMMQGRLRKERRFKRRTQSA